MNICIYEIVSHFFIMNDSDLYESDSDSDTSTSSPKMQKKTDDISVTIDEKNAPDTNNNSEQTKTKKCSTCILDKQRKEECRRRCVQLFCGTNFSYFSCVLCYGLIPSVLWFIICLLVSGLVWGLVGGQIGLIVGIVFLCASVIGAYAFVHFSICYSHYYPSNNVGSKGCCPWFCNCWT